MPCDFISSTMFVFNWSFPANAMSRQITLLGFPRDDAAQGFQCQLALQTNRQCAVRHIVKCLRADFAALDFARQRQVAFQNQFVKQGFIAAILHDILRHQFQLLSQSGGVFGRGRGIPHLEIAAAQFENLETQVRFDGGLDIAKF